MVNINKKLLAVVLLSFITILIGGTVQAQAPVNDPAYDQQWHLKKVNMPAVWNQYTTKSDMVIAILDTGVDHNHPDLRDNLIAGYNVLHPNRLPADDYGHGTQVAGVLAAVGNNNLFGTGVLQQAKIMPIKVLDASGEGDAANIARGIRYAVDNNVKIILMALGDRLYSREMEDAVQYAESKNVLLIAAVGNNSSTINYPAAFPSVLAVGASDRNDNSMAFNNYGPELDILAPGQSIYTTNLSGGMVWNSGTSTAAPIVAGIAAMVWEKYPKLTAWQVRQHLLDTAVKNPSSAFWSEKNGFGRVDAWRALTREPQNDFIKTNNTWQTAAPIANGRKLHLALEGANDQDWFSIDLKNPGKINFSLSSNYNSIGFQLYSGTQVDGSNVSAITQVNHSNNITLPSGKYYIRVSVGDRTLLTNEMQSRGINASVINSHSFMYSILYKYDVYMDEFEPNNSIRAAKEIVLFEEKFRDQNRPWMKLEGTLHRAGDSDWFVLDFPLQGQLTISVVNEYGRFDPVLVISKELTEDKTKYIVVDDHEHGAGEFWSGKVNSGKVWFMVADYSLRAHVEPYEVRIDWEPDISTTRKTNKDIANSQVIKSGERYDSHLTANSEQSWYRFSINEVSSLKAEVNLFTPYKDLEQQSVEMVLYRAVDNRLGTTINNTVLIARESPYYSATKVEMLLRNLEPGNYYLLVQNATKITDRNVVFPTITKVELQRYTGQETNGNYFFDVFDETTKQAVNSLAEAGIIKGYPNELFMPLSNITRAELIALIYRTIDASSLNSLENGNGFLASNYHDLHSNHWAYNYMVSAVNSGIIIGYDDNSIRPNTNVTRAELAVILNRVYKNIYINKLQRIEKGTDKPWSVEANMTINDISSNHWAYTEIVNSVDTGYINTISNKFNANANSTRADVAIAIYRIMSDK